jgi:hypothetical protein
MNDPNNPNDNITPLPPPHPGEWTLCRSNRTNPGLLPPPPSNPRALNPPPPDELQRDMGTITSKSLLSSTPLTVPPTDSQPYMPVGRCLAGRRTSSLDHAILNKVVTDPVDTVNFWDPLTQDSLSPGSINSTTDTPAAANTTSSEGHDPTWTFDPNYVAGESKIAVEIAAINEILAISPTPNTPGFMDELEKHRDELMKDWAKTTDELQLRDNKISDTRNMTTIVWQDLKQKLDEMTTGILETLKGVTEATATLTNRIKDHQSWLSNLMSFEEQQQAQMDNHWRQMTDLKETIDGMQTRIADDRAASLIRSQCLTAQLDGLRSTLDQATTTDRSDIVDIRARLIPGLCS